MNEFFQSAISGTQSIGEAFGAMAQSIIGSLAQIGAELATSSLLNLLGLGRPQQTGGLGGAIAGMLGGDTSLPIFKDGGEVREAFAVPNFASGGNVDPLRTAITNAFKKEGNGAVLAVMHGGEQVLSDRQGEAQTYRFLEKHFGKNPLSKIPIPTFMNGGTVGAIETRLLSGLNTYQSPRLSLPENGDRRGMAAATTNTVTVNINDKESRFYRQSRTLARELADELRG
jgi:hypothetical protein